MKPIVTWVLVADTREMTVFENRGPGKGLSEVRGVKVQPRTFERPRDRAGMGHSIAGHGGSAVEQTSPQEKAETLFAHDLAEAMSDARSKGKFDRLIVAAGPHMLGLLRSAFDAGLQAVVIGEIDKDLTGQPAKLIASKIGEFVAV